MEKGNLSNIPAKSIGIRFEGVIKKSSGELDREARVLAEQTSWDKNVFILTTGDSRKVHSFCYKYNIPCTKILEVNTLEIPQICQLHEFITYYDADRRVIEQVGLQGKVRTKGVLWT